MNRKGDRTRMTTGKQRIGTGSSQQANACRNEQKVLVTSGDRWPNASLTRLLAGASDSTEVCLLRHTITVYLGAPMRYELFSPGWRKRAKIDVFPWDVSVLPARLNIGGCADISSEWLQIEFNPGLFQEGSVGSACRKELTPSLNTGNHSVAQLAIALADDLDSGSPQGTLYGDALLLGIVGHIYRSTAKDMFSNGMCVFTPAALGRVIELIYEQMETGVTLAELAACGGVDQFSFLRFFRRTTGLTPHQFLIRARVDRAKEMLRFSKLPVTEIAMRCGFASASHFAGTFKKFVGVTALEFRVCS
jgi:AraC-type DNA-binding domain-containing proteins